MTADAPASDQHNEAPDMATGTKMTLRRYVAQLSTFTVSSGLAIGLVVCVLLLITGGADVESELTVELSRFDGLWFLAGLPILALVVALVLSPLSFAVHRLMFRSDRGSGGTAR